MKRKLKLDYCGITGLEVEGHPLAISCLQGMLDDLSMQSLELEKLQRKIEHGCVNMPCEICDPRDKEGVRQSVRKLKELGASPCA